MNSIRDLVTEKGHDVYTIAPAATVLDAVKMLAEQNVGALVVMEKPTSGGAWCPSATTCAKWQSRSAIPPRSRSPTS